MSRPFAIVTPSYAPDYEPCRLLAETVTRCVTPAFEHYIVVDRRDLKLFAGLSSPRTHIVAKQEVLPWFLHQAPWTANWWINVKGLPVRGWVLQQVIKLSACAQH